jgi:hypothetical protein
MAQLTIRTLWTLFEADPFDVVETIVPNGHIRSIDKCTGADIFPVSSSSVCNVVAAPEVQKSKSRLCPNAAIVSSSD